mmetsp:Transcript_10198/g.24526  ORF Transcript_10198/g.24526 Transcript_10198/m.24526 type:complete len:203 (-) Transcript_10198:344-952(-)
MCIANTVRRSGMFFCALRRAAARCGPGHLVVVVLVTCPPPPCLRRRPRRRRLPALLRGRGTRIDLATTAARSFLRGSPFCFSEKADIPDGSAAAVGYRGPPPRLCPDASAPGANESPRERPGKNRTRKSPTRKSDLASPTGAMFVCRSRRKMHPVSAVAHVKVAKAPKPASGQTRKSSDEKRAPPTNVTTACESASTRGDAG